MAKVYNKRTLYIEARLLESVARARISTLQGKVQDIQDFTAHNQLLARQIGDYFTDQRLANYAQPLAPGLVLYAGEPTTEALWTLYFDLVELGEVLHSEEQVEQPTTDVKVAIYSLHGPAHGKNEHLLDAARVSRMPNRDFEGLWGRYDL